MIGPAIKNTPREAMITTTTGGETEDLDVQRKRRVFVLNNFTDE